MTNSNLITRINSFSSLRPQLRTTATYVSLLGVFAIAALMLFWRLGRGSLWAWDEAVYSEVSKEIITSGEYLTLRLNYHPWFDKPPLFMWLTTIFYQLFSINEFWSRAASALCGVALVVLTYLLGKMIESRAVGIASALVLLTSYQFVHQARFGTMDVMLTLFLYVAIYAYWRMGEQISVWWFLACASSGLAIMTKGPAGLVAPAVIGILLLLDGRLLTLLRRDNFWVGVLLAFLVAAPWHLYMYSRYPREFINGYLLFHTVVQATTVIDKHAHDSWFYVGVLKEGFYPWIYVAPFAIGLGLRQALAGMFRVRAMLLVVFLVFIGYTMARTGLPWYIVPVYPALAILVGYLLVCGLEGQGAIPLSALVLGSILIVFQGRTKFLLVGGFLSAICFSFLYLFRKLSVHRSAFGALLLLFTLAGLGRLRPLYNLQDSPIARLSRLAAPLRPEDREPLTLGPALPPSTALFYSNRPIIPMGDCDATRHLFRQGAPHFILDESDLPPLLPYFDVQITARDGSLVLAAAVPKKLSSEAIPPQKEFGCHTFGVTY